MDNTFQYVPNFQNFLQGQQILKTMDLYKNIILTLGKKLESLYHSGDSRNPFGFPNSVASIDYIKYLYNLIGSYKTLGEVGSFNSSIHAGSNSFIVAQLVTSLNTAITNAITQTSGEQSIITGTDNDSLNLKMTLIKLYTESLPALKALVSE